MAVGFRKFYLPSSVQLYCITLLDPFRSIPYSNACVYCVCFAPDLVVAGFDGVGSLVVLGVLEASLLEPEPGPLFVVYSVGFPYFVA